MALTWRPVRAGLILDGFESCRRGAARLREGRSIPVHGTEDGMVLPCALTRGHLAS
jgi:hypothetical protein